MCCTKQLAQIRLLVPLEKGDLGGFHQFRFSPEMCIQSSSRDGIFSASHLFKGDRAALSGLVFKFPEIFGIVRIDRAFGMDNQD